MSLYVDIKKKFKGFSLDVKVSINNKSVAILGESGSGKSMTLKCIAGIEKPDSGIIKFGDKILFDSKRGINLPPQKRKVGYLFQSYALFPHMTIEKNIECGLTNRSIYMSEHIAELIDLFQLSGLEKRYPNQLSGGQQQRVALARILASKPEVLLFDEPFSALDLHLKEEIQIEFMNLMRSYDGDIVIVTHSRDEAFKMCQDLLVVENGRVSDSGNTKIMFKKCNHVSSARITGCKNIVNINKIDNYKLYVPNWNCEFNTEESIKDEITHIGIRARSFKPIYDNYQKNKANNKSYNKIDVVLAEVFESPFHWDVLLSCGEKGKVWWKHEKGAGELRIPTNFLVLPQDIMLLKSGEARRE